MSSANNKGRMSRRKKMEPWYYVGPIFLLLVIMFGYPLIKSVVMAFQNYKPRTGILHSEFVGLEKFRMLFSDMTFIRVIRNTLAMGVINLVVTFFTAIAFAVLLNEIKSKGGKKVVQTISYLPHFLSWIIVTGILHDALSGTGIINELLVNFGILDQPLNFFAYPKYFWPIVAFAMYGKRQGWNAIIYYLRSQQSILHSMKLQIWMVRAAGQESNMSHFPELSRRS